MKNITQSLITIGLSLASMTLMATTQPLKLATDSRIEVVTYSPYNVVPIQGTTFTTTQITFSKSEYIENVQNGDLGAWTASISKDIPYMMFVKPTVYGSNTNMTVVTNQHTYYFHLQSNTKDQTSQEKATFAIHFVYPNEQLAKTVNAIRHQHKQTQQMITPSVQENHRIKNHRYSFSGDSRFLIATKVSVYN